MRTYEVLFILSPRLPEEQLTGLITEFRSIAEQNGATVASDDAWGRRRLAYPINKINDGIYHLFILESDQEPHELDRRMKNSDAVMRHMIVRTDAEQRRAVKLAKKNPPKVRKPIAAPAAAPAAAATEPMAAAEAAPATEPAPVAPETATATAETPAETIAETPAAAPAEAAVEAAAEAVETAAEAAEDEAPIAKATAE